MTSAWIASLLVGLSASGLIREIHSESQLLVTVGKSEPHVVPGVAYVVTSEGIFATPQPKVGTFAGIDWGARADEVLISASVAQHSSAAHIEVMRLDGTLQRTHPSLPVKEFVEEDGRLTRGGANGPARTSADGMFVALAANERALAVLNYVTGAWILGVTRQANEFDWSPTGHTLAYTRPEEVGELAASTSQLFLYDVDSRQERQLTHFATAESQNGKVKRKPLVAGVSWARRANLILFYNAPDRGLHVWTPDGEQVAFLSGLLGHCWRKTQLSADGQHIFYLSSSLPKLCALNGGDEIRRVNIGGSDDRVIVRAEPGYVIYDFDLWAK